MIQPSSQLHIIIIFITMDSRKPEVSDFMSLNEYMAQRFKKSIPQTMPYIGQRVQTVLQITLTTAHYQIPSDIPQLFYGCLERPGVVVVKDWYGGSHDLLLKPTEKLKLQTHMSFVLPDNISDFPDLNNQLSHSLNALLCFILQKKDFKHGIAIDFFITQHNFCPMIPKDDNTRFPWLLPKTATPSKPPPGKLPITWNFPGPRPPNTDHVVFI